MASKEKAITNSILLAIGSATKLFRNNVAFSWQGKKVEDRKTRNGRVISLLNPRPINSGLTKGASDLIGWTTVEVTPDMVGSKVAVFTAVEVKTPSMSVSNEQQNFIKVLKEDGGFAGIARSEEEAISIVTLKPITTNGENTTNKRNKSAGASGGEPRSKARKSRNKTQG